MALKLRFTIQNLIIGLGNIYDSTNAWSASESGWDVTYKVAQVDGLSLRARANYPRDFKEGLDWDEYRLIVNYNFLIKEN